MCSRQGHFAPVRKLLDLRGLSPDLAGRRMVRGLLPYRAKDNDMRPLNQPGLPVLPDADVLEAIRRLELTGPRECDDLGPSVEAGVSGRTASAGGPLVSPPLRDLGLLLDDELIDNLLMLEGPNVSIPVEMALDALADPAGGEKESAVAGETAGDTLGARWRLRSWSGHDERDGRGDLTDTLAPAPPA